MADALLNLEGNEPATVVVVDWRGGSQPPFGQATANIRLVGVMTAHLIKNIYVSIFIMILLVHYYTGREASDFRVWVVSHAIPVTA